MAAHHLVPTVDISAPTADSLEAIDAACSEHGFFLMSGHGLDSVIDTTWGLARAFFDGDRGDKVAVMRDHDNPLGYFDRELTKRKRDHKEVFDFTDPRSPRDSFNRWPGGPEAFGADFRTGMVDFFDAFSELALRTTELVHRALGLDPAAVADYRGDRSMSSVRLNHYPVGDPVPVGERDDLQELGATALGHHTDPGVLTLLLQDDTGGLQAQALDGSWVDIEPQAGTVVVNLADAVQVWTNDRYRAAIHRVAPMTNDDRISIPYFLNPPREATVEPIPALADGRPKYAAFEWRSYMQARTEDNFEDLGADDAQISDYLIHL